MPSSEISIPKDVRITCNTSSIPADDLERLDSSDIFADIGVDEEREVPQVTDIEVDMHVLAEFVYKYETLERVASHPRVRVLQFFRKSSGNKYTTGEVAEELDIDSSTASRHLGKLDDDGHLTKIQRGVYELSLD